MILKICSTFDVDEFCARETKDMILSRQPQSMKENDVLLCMSEHDCEECAGVPFCTED